MAGGERAVTGVCMSELILKDLSEAEIENIKKQWSEIMKSYDGKLIVLPEIDYDCSDLIHSVRKADGDNYCRVCGLRLL